MYTSNDELNINGICMPGYIDDELRTFHWPQLRSLSLAGFTTIEEALTDLLQAHSATLQELELSHMHLESVTSSCILVFQAIGIHMVNLVSLAMEGEFTGDDFREFWDAGLEEVDSSRKLANGLHDLITKPLHSFDDRLSAMGIECSEKEQIAFKKDDIAQLPKQYRELRISDFGSDGEPSDGER